jgi:hypothetical protein
MTKLRSNLIEFLKFLAEILVAIIGSSIFLVLGLVGFLYSLLKHFYLLDYSLKRHVTPIIRVYTLLFDCFANAAAGELLNDTLKAGKHIRYGKWHQTISAVTGLIHKHVKGSKQWFRKMLDTVLGKNHCVEAIQVADEYYYNMLSEQEQDTE